MGVCGSLFIDNADIFRKTDEITFLRDNYQLFRKKMTQEKNINAQH